MIDTCALVLLNFWMSLIPFTISDRRDESDQIQQKASREGGFTCEGLSQ